MALPSSNRSNRVSAVAQAPQINLANYTPNPAAIPAAVSNGIALGNQVADTLTLTPVQRQADIAGAVLRRDTANSASSLLPQQTSNASQKLDTEHTQGDTDSVFAALTNTIAKNPLFQEEFRNELVRAQGAKTAKAGTALTQAAAEEARAPKEEAIKGNELNVRGAVSDDVTSAQLSPEAQKQRIGAVQDANTAAAGAASIAAAPFAPATRAAVVQGAQDTALAGAVQARQGLAQASLGSGNGAPLSADVRDKFYQDASKEGVNIFNPNGTLRTVAEVSDERTKRSNANDPGAQKILEKVRTDGDKSQELRNVYEQVERVMRKAPATGVLFSGGLSNPVNFVDNLLAMAGNDNAAAREQLSQAQSKLVLAATDGKLGSGISNADSILLQNAGPNIARSGKTNRELIVAGLSAANRGVEKPSFYEKLTPLVGASAADSIWRQYVESNPLINHNASSASKLVLNDTTLTPDQYLEAVQNPRTAVVKFAPKPGDKRVPLVVRPTNGQPPALDPSQPYVILVDDISNPLNSAGKPVPNPLYWNPIIEVNGRLPASSSPAQVQSSQQDFVRRLSAPITDFVPTARAPVAGGTTPASNGITLLPPTPIIRR